MGDKWEIIESYIIADWSGISPNSVGKYLKTLSGLGLVERRVPFGSNPDRSRSGVYGIADPFFAFWYRFVGPAIDAIELGAGAAVAAQTCAGQALPTYEGAQFERVCMQWLARKNGTDALPFLATSFGRWWGASPEERAVVDVDVIAASKQERMRSEEYDPETIDHVGVYSSEGCVYHAKDRAHGVVRESFCENAWTFWSELPAYAGNSNLASYTAPSPNHSGQRTHPITKITPHYMVGNLPIEICGGLFADEEYGASSNYGIGSDGRIALYVDERCRSWASASPWNDQRAVTIECANLADGSLSDACWSALVDLCADICIRNGIEDCSYTGDKDGVLTMHCMFADTECPGPWLFGQFGRLSREVNARLMRCAGR